MLRNLLLCFIILVCVCLITTVVVFAESEPNNLPSTATPLALNSSDGGSLNDSTDQNDWWVVTTTVDGALYIETNSDAGVDVDLRIFDDIDGNNLVASYDISIGQKETTHHNSLLPGTYYVKAN